MADATYDLLYIITSLGQLTVDKLNEFKKYSNLYNLDIDGIFLIDD